MTHPPAELQTAKSEIGIYDCEMHLNFRLIEEKSALADRDRLLEILLDALVCGVDEYLESLHIQIDTQEVSEMDASPSMRRQLIRLRNSAHLVS